VFDLDLDAAEKVAAGIRTEGGAAEALRCDITDRGSVDAAVLAAESRLRPIDVLVNNAGWDVFKPFTKTEPAQWDRLIAINLTGALHMHHAVLPGMAARRKGRIGQPDDLPGAILHFASDDAAYVTGQVLSVSGGLTMNG
jgi:2-hydroxycyclohexanecarboxyl-CoA dehydrogenase